MADEREPLLSASAMQQRSTTESTKRPSHTLTSSLTSADVLLGQRSAGLEPYPAWGAPAGLVPRGPNDENLVLFRHSVGINTSSASHNNSPPGTYDVKSASGIYAATIAKKNSTGLQYSILNGSVYLCHMMQIVSGAVITALGPSAGNHTILVTVLGGLNTVTGGVLALFRGQGLPERIHRYHVELQRLQDWIEETDALLAAGVIGRDRREVGFLIETAFKKYNDALSNKEYTNPESDVRQQRGESDGNAAENTRSTYHSNDERAESVRMNPPAIQHEE